MKKISEHLRQRERQIASRKNRVEFLLRRRKVLFNKEMSRTSLYFRRDHFRSIVCSNTSRHRRRVLFCVRQRAASLFVGRQQTLADSGGEETNIVVLLINLCDRSCCAHTGGRTTTNTLSANCRFVT